MPTTWIGGPGGTEITSVRMNDLENRASVGASMTAGTLPGASAFGKSVIAASDAAAGRVLVGLYNVNNTADVDKPVSIAQQTALNLKANLAGPTFTGVCRIASYATGSRPTAAGVAGGMVYDSTLHKPIWSDGTVWRDAAGTAV